MEQSADDIWAQFERHVKQHAPGIVVRRLGSMEPSRTPVGEPYVKVMAQAVERATGERAVRLTVWTGERPYVSPSSGGSLPDYAFTRDLGLPLVTVPYANADEANHAPNENLELRRRDGGINIAASVYEALARGAS